MLQARFTESEEAADEAIAVARAVGDRGAEARALNALGTAIGGRGDAETGVKLLRESLAIAREMDLPMEQGGALINISEILHQSGRSDEALEVARQGLTAGISEPYRTVDWLHMSFAEICFDLGNWEEAEDAIPAPSRRHTGGTLFLWQVMRATLALGRGDLELAETALSALDGAVAGMTEPQFVAPYGILRGELARHRGDVDRARALVDEALDRIEYCSDDLARITAVAAAGLRIEGDAGQVARDRRDEDTERRARERADALLVRVRVAAEGAGAALASAELASAEAEYARATGADAMAPWAAAAESWEALKRPYPAAYARWREAEALMAARDREGAARAAADALAAARRLGSAWLAEEVESLAARARLQLGAEAPGSATGAGDGDGDEPDDPFGLTPRERDVLALVASGATNREIGERLHMAEKTASVHVSRILAKLNVRSRTEAAAVAHRQGLVPTA
jgi:DNA-binding NarL/FixJ family response regulator